MAESYGKECCLHGGDGAILRASLHVIGATSISWCECQYNPPAWTIEARDILLKRPTRIDKDGYLEMPKEPGLGIELNEELVAKYTVQEG